MILWCIGEDDAAEKHKRLFRARLDQIINMKRELVLLAGGMDWD
jgi:hypothetical protein